MKVEYHEKEQLPGKKFFECPSGLGTISTDFCSKSHTDSNTPAFIAESRRHHCRHCVIGMCHSGKRDTVSGSRFYQSKMCVRCHRNAGRLLKSSSICIPCYNRQAECRKGQLNSKGHPLTKVRQYRDIQLLTITGNQVKLSTARQVMTCSEAVLGTLHKSSEAVSFAWTAPNIQK